MHTRHLLLNSLYNARDLGGYPTADGGVTRFGVFLRCEAPCDLPESDVQTLLNYGVTASLDLRSDGERLARPTTLSTLLPYYEESLFAQAAIYGQAPPPSPTSTWLQRYIGMAEISKAWAVRVLEIAAERPGCLLYHCTTGKDRTGLLSCYLLSIAGVPAEDIAADYCISQLFLQPVYNRMRSGKIPLGQGPTPIQGEPQGGDSFFDTPASAMLGLIDYFRANYGGVIGYLKAAGLSDDVMEKIRAKFVER